MVRRTKEQAEETRQAILDAAELVFLAQGVARTSLADIAQRAGVTRGAVYWHFKDKDDLLLAMRERVDRPVWEWLGSRRQTDGDDPLRMLHEACLEVLRRLDTDEHYRNVHAIFLTRYEMAGPQAAGLTRQMQLESHELTQLTDDFERARGLGLLREDMSPRLAALSLFAMMHGIYLSWLRAPSRFSLADEAPAMVAHFFDGLRAPPRAVRPRLMPTRQASRGAHR